MDQGFLARLGELEADARIPVRKVLRWLDSAVETSRDPDLGLRAVGRIESGSYAVLEHLSRSAATYGEALELQVRYVRLVNEAAMFSFDVRGSRAFVELRSRVPLTRAAADFQAGSLLVAARAFLGSLAGFVVCFAHEAPADRSAYAELLPHASVVFGAPSDSFSFEASLLSVPMKAADPQLHAVLRHQAERLMEDLPGQEDLTERTRKLLLHLLPAGDASAEYVAQRLGVSRRTLARHLEREGVTHRQLLEQARRELALHYLANPQPDIQQIAFMLGYSETAALSRAFRRWCGQSPTAYRRDMLRRGSHR